jgi:phosphoglycolate phosphatase-like HAD superfamily hydrolase
MAKSSLILFDIDGTLLSTGGSGYRSFMTSCREVLGITGQIDGVYMAGKLDRVIFQEIIERFRPDLALSDIAPCWHRFRDMYIELLGRESRQPENWRLMPGVEPLLEFCSRQGSLALLTGNIREGAYIKLAALGIEEYFPVGGFGEKSITRSQLAKVAWEEAEKYYQTVFSPDDIFVIGDTTSDIQAGKSIGARTIAVATGTVSQKELSEAGADLLVSDFASGADNVRRLISR